MIDRLLRSVTHWLVMLFAAAFAVTLLTEAARSGSDPATRLIGLALVSFVAWHLGEPLWRILKAWQRRRPEPQRPQLPTPAQWITPRENRRRNRELR
jgi:hypothetical protein